GRRGRSRRRRRRGGRLLGGARRGRRGGPGAVAAADGCESDDDESRDAAHRRGYFPPTGFVFGLSLTRKSFPSRTYSRRCSSRLNGRAPTRPKTASWLPLSSTARSRSSGLLIVSAWPAVGYVAISSGLTRGLKPPNCGTVSG